MTAEQDTSNGAMRALVAAVVAHIGSRLVPTLAIVGLAAALEGAGIVLLLPLAETVFAQAEGKAPSGVTARLVDWMTGMGLDTVMEQLAVLGAAFLALLALRAAVTLRRDVLLLQLSLGFVDAERRRFFGLLASADWPVIKRYRKADLLNAMTVNIGRIASAMNFVSRGLVTAAMGLAYLAAAFTVSWILGGVLVAMTLVGAAFALVWSRRSQRSGEQLNRANRGVMDETTRFLDGLKAAKAARAEKELTDRFAATIAETRAIHATFVRQQARLRNTIQVLAGMVALLVLLLGFGLLGLSGGELLVMAAIILRLSPSLLSTFSGVQSIAHAVPAFAALRQAEAEIAADHHALQRPAKLAPTVAVEDMPPAPLELVDTSVEVSNAQGDRVTLVETGTITIKPGTLVHIGGPSGAGKSTLAELVAGLHLPATGSVSCGTLELSAATRRQWQARVAFAPQEPFLFDRSVRENLLWPNHRCDEAAIWQALDDAHASAIVRDLPGGLDEELLDGGARLSGGERQRLCLARALLRPASLLILDEATSAMDPELERLIVATLKRHAAQRIVLMVSHSRNALDLADMRIEVASGKARVV